MKNIYMSWEDFDIACKQIADQCKAVAGLKAVFGIPRGGLVVAVRLSHLLNLPLTFLPASSSLITDDIADTGRTLLPFSHMITATLYYNPRSKVEPTFWVFRKTIGWIVFPWEVLSK